ncbi:MAG: CehA/McbA family metallohydrolase [Gemmatimonadota bacterium]
MKAHSCLTAGLFVLIPLTVEAQWTHRYPKLAGFSHHVYLEGYEMPLLTSGPIDPAPSPDGRSIAFGSRGWLWLMDLSSGAAARLTKTGEMDARAAWSPDGKQIAFVRDDSKDTKVMLLDVASLQERVLVDEPAIDLDPAFSADGKSVFYSSGVAGDLDLWRIDLATNAKTRLTTETGIELRPLAHPDGKRLVYIAKGSGHDDVRIRDLATGEERVLARGSIISNLRPSLSPDGKTIALTWPASDASGWELKLLGVEQPGPTVLLTGGHGLPVTPAWSADGRSVYFVEADDRQVMRLYRIGTGGGLATELHVSSWQWGVETAKVRIMTALAANPGQPAPARLAVRDGTGHPAIPDETQARFDGQNGIVFFYSPGTVEVTVPAGAVEVMAVQGLATPVVRAQTQAAAGEIKPVPITLTPLWDAKAAGWLAGEHHFHLNYGGPYHLTRADLLPMAAGEAMDVLTPLLANLHTRFEDQPLFAGAPRDQLPFIRFGQEVRAHFFGHVALVGADSLFWPWIWGPGYEVYSRDDRPNREALDFGRRHGGMNLYVHPVVRPNPFGPEGAGTVPTGFIADLVQGKVDGLEVACLWSDELGTTDLWYRALNLGFPVAATAGTDVMNNLYRTMAVGTTRVYVRTDPARGLAGYLENLAAGRSFVTNGPMLDFHVAASGPGDVIPRGKGKTPWSLTLSSSVPVERVELIVNGAVASTLPGLTEPGSRLYRGELALPAGGWVAIRAVSGATAVWPAMDSYAFAHSGPVWIGARGSTIPDVKRQAARELLTVFDTSEKNFQKAYDGVPAPALRAHYAAARAILDSLAAPASH